jgi:TPR repeat protein
MVFGTILRNNLYPKNQKMKKHSVLIFFISAIYFAVFSQEGEILNLNTADGVEGYIYSGHRSTKKSKKAFKEIKLLSEQGDAEAGCLLGILYKDGIGTRRNFNKARKQFKKAYGLGSEKAAYSLGYLYLKGLGNIEQDYKKALEWFEKSNYRFWRDRPWVGA